MSGRVGRPPLPEGQKRDALFCVRVTPVERALIERAATLDGKQFNVSEWGRHVLIEMAKVVIEEKNEPPKE
jgi:uncharacterized protein (DUF1778 family)